MSLDFSSSLDKFSSVHAVPPHLDPQNRKISEIIPGGVILDVPGYLYLGNMSVGHGKKTLKTYKINVVLNVMMLGSPVRVEGVTYYHVPIDEIKDARVIDKFFPKTNKILDTHLSRGHNVFVHCMAGQHRSVAVVVAYLMYSQGMSYERAFACIKKRRSAASKKFLGAMKRYEKGLFKKK